MEYLALEVLAIRSVGIAAAEGAVVCDDDQLEHMVAKCQSHLVKGFHISVECRNREDV